jgi:putative membrane protein
VARPITAREASAMVRFFLQIAAVALGLWLSWKVVPGVRFDGLESLVFAALLLGLANAIVRPVLAILTLPLTIVTLGLWLIVLNAAMIGLVAWLLKGFSVQDWIAAFLTWVVVTVTSWVAGALIGRD